MSDGVWCWWCCETFVWQEVIPATGHTEEVIPGYAPTCTETGLTDGVRCIVCDEILTEREEIPATDHTEEILPYKAATCTEDGLTEGKKCSVCGEILVEQEVIEAEGHYAEILYGYWETCTEDGLTDGEYCYRCGEILWPQEVIPARGHQMDTMWGYPPTCTEDGMTDGIYCVLCDKILKAQKEIAALGHAYDASGACACGATRATVSVVEDEVVVNANDTTGIKIHAFNITGKEVSDINAWNQLKAADPNFKTYTKSAFTLKNGTYVLRIQYTDAEGTANVISDKITVDYTPAPVIGPAIAVEDNVVSVTDNGATDIKIFAFNITGKEVSDINVWNQLKVADPNFKTYTKSAFALKNGDYVLRVQYTDAEGVTHAESHAVKAESAVPQAVINGKTVTVDAKGTNVSKIHVFFTEGKEITDPNSWNALKAADASFKSYKKSQFSVRNSGAYILRIEYVDQYGIAQTVSQLITAQ